MVAEINPGWAAGIGQRGTVKRLGWALKGAPARRNDLRLSPLSAIAEGRKLRDRINTLMSEAGADPGDAMVFCVFSEPDLSEMVPEVAHLPVNGGLGDLRLIEKHPYKLPIGFLVFVLDRGDPQQPIFGHARPLIVQDPRAIAMNQTALEAYARKIKNRLAGAVRSESGKH